MNKLLEGATADSIKYNKQCKDFICLNDGTFIGECRYCELSRVCRQIDMKNGKAVSMESNYLPMVEDGKVIGHELFCTGMYDDRPLKERIEDDKVS